MSIIVITGASQGIGQAIAERFAREEGAQLALVARNEEKLKAVAQTCQAQGAIADVFPCDVTNDEAVERMGTAVLEQFGIPDVVVNNAGAFVPTPLSDTSATVFRQQIEVNLTSSFLVTQAFLPAMRAAKAGHFFYMASVASLRAYPGSVAYCAAKHGLLGLARVVREETKEEGLRVTNIFPGATFTPSWEGVSLPEDRFMPASDVAQAVFDVYHLSDRTVVEELLLRPQLGDI